MLNLASRTAVLVEGASLGVSELDQGQDQDGRYGERRSQPLSAGCHGRIIAGRPGPSQSAPPPG